MGTSDRMNRGAFARLIAGATIGVAAGALPARAASGEERVLWLARPSTGERVHAAFTTDGGTKFDLEGYYRLCIAFRDASPGVDPKDGYVQIDPIVIDALWEIQRYYRAVYNLDPAIHPIDIYSGFRTPATNERVGGKPGSLHMQARAVDWAVRGVPVEHTGRVALAMPSALVGGVGIYFDDLHIHTDSGSRTGRVWCNHDEETCPKSLTAGMQT